MATKKAAKALANLKYGEAKDRLEQILEELESNEVDIDDLADRVREARDLIRVLNDKLTRTQGEVRKVMEEFAEEEAAGSAPSDAEGTDDGSAEAEGPDALPF